VLSNQIASLQEGNGWEAMVVYQDLARLVADRENEEVVVAYFDYIEWDLDAGTAVGRRERVTVEPDLSLAMDQCVDELLSLQRRADRRRSKLANAEQYYADCVQNLVRLAASGVDAVRGV
jgi:hypothetical protein